MERRERAKAQPSAPIPLLDRHLRRTATMAAEPFQVAAIEPERNSAE
jgi:hypothetical protein